MISFAHIAPIPHLDLVAKQNTHLVLAHLVEQSTVYADFYRNLNNPNATIILDNSAFEMFKQGKPMFESDRLADIGQHIKANYIVMSDYPNQHHEKTIDAARVLAPKFKEAGFGTFFCPQSTEGNIESLIRGYNWAVLYAELIDYVGISILNVPNAYGVERGNKLQRYVARLRFMHTLRSRGILDKLKYDNIKIHFLGMTDGPNEIQLVDAYRNDIDTWDSGAAIWAGLNGISFDNSPTGLINGKFEKEVDFDYYQSDNSKVLQALINMKYIDNACQSRRYGV